MKFKWYGNRVIGEVKSDVKKRMTLATIELRNEMQSTLTGQRTGRIYPRPGGKGGTYQASAPGEPPAEASGKLLRSIDMEVVVKGTAVIGRAGSRLRDEYPIALEYGFAHHWSGEWVEARPWLRPSLRKTWPKIKKIMGAT